MNGRNGGGEYMAQSNENDLQIIFHETGNSARLCQNFG
jgi:hypothetical protein